MTYIPTNYTPKLVQVETVYGDRLYVDRKSLDGNRTFLRLYFSTGRPYGDSYFKRDRECSMLHRENIKRVLP